MMMISAATEILLVTVIIFPKEKRKILTMTKSEKEKRV